MSDEDEYGDIEEDLWDQAFTQASQTLPSNSEHRRKRRRLSADDELDDDEVDFRPRRRSRDSAGTGDDEDANGNKQKKIKVHYGAEEVPAAVILGATQADAMPDSSPYRIRGPIYRKPRPIPEPVPIAVPQQRPAPVLQTREVSRPTTVSRPSNAQKKTSTPAPVDDYTRELEDLPSDAFSPSPSPSPEQGQPDTSITITSSPPTFTQPFRSQRLVAPQNGLKQTTLFGGRAPNEPPSATQAKKVHNYLVNKTPELPTHHALNREALNTWVYPTNLGSIREYQYSIVHSGLFNNLLVALPTGLGKTFIAATIMLNFFRWTKDAQIVFVAPTKPLVSQQVKACFEIAGIPRSVTTMLTGDQQPALRAEEWAEKRVFFMTPQTIDNDLKSGIADPKKIVLLIVDEAHRATGNYSYVKVVQFIRRFNKSFRVLALTATPGATVEAVQEVIDNLEIAKVEIRTEESMDIRQYVHRRDIDEILLDPSDEIIMVKELFSNALQPLVNKLCANNCYYNKDPMSLTQFGMLQARKTWMGSAAGRSANMGLKGMVNALFTVLTSVAHSIKLLNFHGISAFYSNINEFRAEVEDGKGGKYKKEIVNHPDFQKMMDRVSGWIKKDDFIGHPKLTCLCDEILNHFLDAGDGLHGDDAPPSSTRVIVFSEYRDSAEDIVRALNKHGPMIRASVFVGQSDSKRSEGMNQEKQLDTIRKFKAGVVNVIVATSIGEEGLDIGQVDLIVCYDSSSSPIRMLQRMGRTGRKRAGRIVLLLMRGKEEDSYRKSKDNYQQMQNMISSGARFSFRHDLSARIVPRDVKPVVDKRIIEIPPENTQDTSLPEPKRRAKPKKKPPKKFHMPDGVETGFLKASRLDDEGNPLTNFGITRKPKPKPKVKEIDELAPIPPLESVLLTPKEMAELDRRFLKVSDNASQEVDMPSMIAQPVTQRSLTRTANVKHGKYTKRCVKLFKTLSELQRPEDRDIKPYGDEPPSDLDSIPNLPLEADLQNTTPKKPKSPTLPKPSKGASTPKDPKPRKPTKSKVVPSKPRPQSKPKSTSHPLRSAIERQLLLEDEQDSDSGSSMVSRTRESQLTQPPADSEEEGPGENVDRTSDMDDLDASEESDIGSLADFLATQTQTQGGGAMSSWTRSSSPPLVAEGRGKIRGRDSDQDEDDDDDDDLPAIEDIGRLSSTFKKRESNPVIRQTVLSMSSSSVATPSTSNMFMKKRAAGRINKTRRVLEDSDSDE
ncbi:atp-dependent dna helicase mph1 protein [Rutstroemia sp. NJR-2017a BVV2]|nr:atp-dependent dna helicase mph1 protein [Rutstroemia sp. NJR-2017a BVV2]